jgi:hypothetical protein
MTRILIKIIAYSIVLAWIIKTKARDIYWFFKKEPAEEFYTTNQPYLIVSPDPEPNPRPQSGNVSGALAMGIYAMAAAQGRMGSATMQAQAAQAIEWDASMAAAQGDIHISNEPALGYRRCTSYGLNQQSLSGIFGGILG